ncbi:MAG: alpha/beta fold hydrolase [Bacteroidales bacterium]|nr:alpha/beta fold hydrolase [Bacteroidales bacterium]
MTLFYRELGEGPPLIILHGLYGSSDNWLSIARKLSDRYHIYLVDQRNHGQSPHDPVHDFPVLSDDLDEFILEHRLDHVILLGHSMGGKTALFYAVSHPDKTSALVVVDISPRTYHIGQGSGTSFGMHKEMMEAMLHSDVSLLSSRQQVMEALRPAIPQERVRQFLLKNLTRDDNHHFKWKINLPVLYDQLPNILKGLDSYPELKDRQITSFPVLFIKGEKSGYISEEDLPVIHQYFPLAEIEVIADAGHWVHAEQPEVFVKTILDFLA